MMRRVSSKYILLIPVFSALVIFEDRGASAQSQPGIAANPLGPFASSVERRRAEQDLRALPLKLRERRERNLNDPEILKQMNEDFLEIQAIRAGMVKTFATGRVIEPGVLGESAHEVKRRASRLRSRLALSEEIADVEIPKQETPSSESINDRAFNLCIEISRFTENPLFRRGSVITIKHANEASKALDSVIALAEAIRKESSTLKRAGR